jgi:hypothetical protein
LQSAARDSHNLSDPTTLNSQRGDKTILVKREGALIDDDVEKNHVRVEIMHPKLPSINLCMQMIENKFCSSETISRIPLSQ